VKIRNKTILIIGVTLVALFAVHLIVSELVVMGAFGQVETQSAQKDTNRVIVALGDDINTLDAVASDWAMRESIWSYVNHAGAGVPEPVIDNQTFERLEFNYILFFNPSGEFIGGRGYDLQTGQDIPIPPVLYDLFLWSANQSVANISETGIMGIVNNDPEPILVASRPVAGTTVSSVAGYVVMARHLDQNETIRLENMAQLPLVIRRYNDSSLPDDFRTAIASFPPGGASFTQRQVNNTVFTDAPLFNQPLANGMLGSYALIRDIHGEPVLVMRLSIPRDIYEKGKSTTIYFISLLLISGISVGVVILLLLDESVLSRLSFLSTRVNSIGGSRDFSARVILRGADEVSQLATNVNSMLEELESSQNQLRHRLIKSEENYRLFFNSIIDPVIIYRFTEGDLSGPIIEANDAAPIVLGYSRDELFGMSMSAIIMPEEGETTSLLAGELLHKSVIQFESSCRTKNGTMISVEVNARVFDQFGHKAVLAIARDITERREIERLKMEAFQQIEENMQQFAILNDHIRNPLQGIIGIADLMENKYSEKIIQLSHVINDIIHKLDRGYLESEKIQEFLRKYYGIGKK
jgi:PAS domain S-box-containing protein